MNYADHIERMHPWLRPRVAAAIVRFREGAPSGESITLIESVRSLETQQRYFTQGRSKADGVRRYSLHQFAPALAADVAVTRGKSYVASAADPAWQQWGAAARAEGLEWGGDWRGLVDAPHVQVPLADRVRLVQAAVGVAVDGQWGAKTQAAVVAALPGVELRPGVGWDSLTLDAWARIVA